MKDLYGEGYSQASRILHDMQTWGGSFVIDPNKTYEERLDVSHYCSTLCGCLTNLYSEADFILRYGQPIVHADPGTHSIGMQEIFLDIPEDDDGELGCKKAIKPVHPICRDMCLPT